MCAWFTALVLRSVGANPSTFRLTNPAAYNGKAVVYSLSELLAFPPPTFLIDTLVPSQAITGLCGGPGVGKSMLALDWALAVGAGRSWMDHAVEPGFALYIAAEGYTGLSIRAKAWLLHNNVRPSQVKFGLVTGRLAIKGAEEDAMTDYDVLLDRVSDELGAAPKLVVIDTLARCIEGDENASLDMTGFLDGAERLIEHYKSSVVVIHHKNAQGSRERGHSSFRGALGAMFYLEKVPHQDGLLVLKTDKQRDAKDADPIGLRMSSVGESAVLEQAALPVKDERGPVREYVMDQKSMMKMLASSEEGLTFNEWRLACGVPRTTFQRRVGKLLKRGDLVKDDSRYYLVGAVSDIAELDE